MSQAPAEEKPAAAATGRFKIILAVAILAIGALGLWFYWQRQSQYPSTEDAYIQANIITIAAQITGAVKSVEITENQPVKAGDVLFMLDDTLLRNAVIQAQAHNDTIAQMAESLTREVDAASAAVASATTAKKAADDQLARSTTLLQQGNIAQSVLETDRSKAAQAAAALDGARSQLAAAQAAVSANSQSALEAAAQLVSAQTNLGQAIVTAPVDGWVTNVSLRPGSVVAAYQPLFSLIDASEWWVSANFKETDLVRIAPGMAVTVSVDMLPGRTFAGHVDSVGMGSGATFALLPAQNASGNWVKVTQRFPLRVALDAVDPGLKVGASATVTVDTTGAGPSP